MLELLSTFSAEQIILFLILLAFASKELINLWDFFKQKINFGFNMKKGKEVSANILKDLVQKVENISARLDLLTESDKDDIRGWIVERYHYYKNIDIPIDSFTMDTIEKRYQHYKDEGGNSYIKDIMEELRDMAKEDKRCSNIG